MLRQDFEELCGDSFDQFEESILIALKRFVLINQLSPTEEHWEEAMSWIPVLLDEIYHD